MAQLVYIDGREAGTSIPLAGRSSIGRSPENAVVIVDDGIADRHAEIRYHEGEFRVRRASPDTAVEVNGRDIIDQALHHGDVMRIGKVSLLFSDEGPSAAPPPIEINIPERKGTTKSFALGDTPPSAGSSRTKTMMMDAEGLLKSFRKSDRISQHLETLYRTSAALNSTLVVHELVAGLLDILTDVFKPDRAFILLADDAGQLQPAAQSITPDCRAKGMVRFSSSVLNAALQRNEAILSENPAADDQLGPNASAVRNQISAALCAPISKGEVVLGAIYLDAVSGRIRYQEDDRTLLGGVAAQAALAIENVLSYKRQTEYTRQLVNLGETSRRVSALLSRELIVKEAVESAGRIFDASKVSLLLVDEASLQLKLEYSLHIPRPEWVAVRIASGAGCAGKVFAEGVAALVSTPVPNPKYQTNSFLVVPVMARSEGLRGATRPIGVLCVTDKKSGRPFDSNDEELANIFTSQVGIALQNARLFEKATVDTLTKLFTRQFFFARLEEEVPAHQQQQAPLCVMMFDLDHFHDINKHGHHVGDIVLSSAARVIKQRALMAGGISGRYGGEEFVTMLPGVSLARGLKIAEEIRAQIENLKLTIDGKSVPVTTSIGVAELAPNDAPETAVRKADGALLQAKKNGRNRVEVFKAVEGA